MYAVRIAPEKYIPKNDREYKGIFYFLNQLIEGIEVRDFRVAKFLTDIIPGTCPFERDIQFYGHKLFHIPPLCKLNPLYDSLMVLRFRAMNYLSEIGECRYRSTSV